MYGITNLKECLAFSMLSTLKKDNLYHHLLLLEISEILIHGESTNYKKMLMETVNYQPKVIN